MKHEDKRDSGLWYVIGGMAIGVALGLLLAPKRGSELREDIASWAARAGKGPPADVQSKLDGPVSGSGGRGTGSREGGGAEALDEVKESLSLDGANK